MVMEGNGNMTDFGYGEAEGHFKFWTQEALGSDPEGVMSACPISLRTFPTAGYIAIYLPFFSSEYLPDEEGTHEQVRDYRLTEATRTNEREPRYYCARYTTNGFHFVQKCNPEPASNSGVARQMFQDMLNFLKRGHWIDKQTRMVSITMQVASNNGGVRYTCKFMFEVTQMAAVLPSFDMEAMVDDEESTAKMKTYMFMALVLTGYFMFLEVVELAQSGLADYFTNVWNVLDWANFMLFFQVYVALNQVLALWTRDVERRVFPADCASVICNTFGYYDTWEILKTARLAKLYMSICVCIQLLKIIKFTNVIVPKMSLMTSVLAKGCYDLLFFGIIFAISMFAFCMLFYIQLGSFMDDFYSQPSSMIALAKALFGDFPFEEIMDNSRGYINGILFLVYLFVAVFILLSMFLAILGEAQAAVREDEMQQKESGEAVNPYGMIGEARDFIKSKMAKIKEKAARRKRKEAGEESPSPGEAEEDEEDEEDELDMAMQTAMNKMQAKLDSSLKQRMSGLEVRLLKELGRMEAKLQEPVSPGCGLSSSAKRASAAGKGGSADKDGGADKGKRPDKGGDKHSKSRGASPTNGKAGREASFQKAGRNVQAALPKRKPSVGGKPDLGVSPPASPKNNLSC